MPPQALAGRAPRFSKIRSTTAVRGARTTSPDMTEVSQAQLLDSYRAGDASAFGELVALHQSSLLRHAHGLLGSGSIYEDVVQEALLKLAQSPPDLPAEVLGDPRREHAQLSSWLHKVTRNLCMDVMRSETRRKRREHDVALDEVHEGGLATVEARDTRAAVEQTLGALPHDQREVLVLRLLGEKSYKEIAEITGKKIGTVGWLVSVGLKALGRELAPLLHGAHANDEAPDSARSLRLAQGEV
jgi:RNA polymerase sigma-70 factor (ECF subfamily)